MMSPESYYSQYIKGKTKAEIMNNIIDLKEYISLLINIIEWPYFFVEDYYNETEYTKDKYSKIMFSRMYLQKAIAAYEETGGEYIPSETEKKSMDFQNNINGITKITFNYFSYFSPERIYIVELSSEPKIYRKLRNPGQREFEMSKLEMLVDNKEFRNNIHHLYLGEWHNKYNDPGVMDGMGWNITFEYNNGHEPVKFEGYHATPYNFNRFHNLIAIDNKW